MSTNPATWMTDNYEALQNRPFSQITLFGSHDSGMSTTKYAGVASLAGSEGITQSQSLPIYEQIVLGGVRYLDIRPAWSGEYVDYYTAHWSYSGISTDYVGWCGISLADVIQQIKSAYAGDPANQIPPTLGANDILLIELSHGTDLGELQASSLQDTQLQDITNLFVQSLGEFLYTDSSCPSFWDLTPSHLVASGKRIFLNAGTNTAVTNPAGPVFPSSAASYWSCDNGSADNSDDAIASLMGSMLTAARTSPSQPMQLGFHCTGQALKESRTLEDMADDLNPLFVDSLAYWTTNTLVEPISFDPSNRRVPAIVQVDYVSASDLRILEASIGMNYGHYVGLALTPAGLSGAKCTQGPALAWTDDSLHVAWAGSEPALNVTTFTDGSGFGTVCTSLSHKATTQSPALCAGSTNLILAWTGTDGKGRPNFSSVSTDGNVLELNPVTLGGQSEIDHGPALAYLNGMLYAAFTGTNNSHTLQVMSCSDEGRTWSTAYSSSLSSSDSPALCVLDDALWIVWKSTDGTLKLAPISLNGDGTVNRIDPGSVTGTGLASAHGPAAVAVGDTMYIAWVGSSDNRLNLISTTDGRSFVVDDHYVSRQCGSATPALGTDGTNLYWAWADRSAQLTVARFLLPGQSSTQAAAVTNPALDAAEASIGAESESPRQTAMAG